MTQRDVALKAGVSHVTVSLALRGSPSIPTRTRKRIEAIAEKLGYSPDPMLSALSAYRKSQRPAAYHANIGWINNYARPEDLYVGDFGRYYQGAQQRARELGYAVEEVRLSDISYNMKRLRRILDAKGVNGLLLAPTESPYGELHLDISTYSVVRVGYSFRLPIVNTVTSAQFRAMLMTMQNLAKRGYRRIGTLLHDDTMERTSFHFVGGFLAAQSLIPKGHRVPPFILEHGHLQKGELQKWLKQHQVDCVIGTGSFPHYEALREAGARIPEEIGFADIALAEDEEYLSGMHQNARKIGGAAVELLVSMIQRSEMGPCEVPSHLLIEASWLEGKTLRPLV